MLTFVRNPEAAQDITAATFAAAFEHFDQFRGESSFYTWLYAIAANNAREWLRSHRTISLDALEGPEPDALRISDAHLEHLEQSEYSHSLQQALSQVPKRYRRPLVQHFIAGRSVKQIACTERVPPGTVLSRLFKAKKLLRRAWNAG
jgi:RNA polymerase sigma-70 factor (ECF subfamily)